MVGGVVSMLMPVTVVMAELPATSLTFPGGGGAFAGKRDGEVQVATPGTAVRWARWSDLDLCR